MSTFEWILYMIFSIYISMVKFGNSKLWKEFIKLALNHMKDWWCTGMKNFSIIHTWAWVVHPPFRLPYSLLKVDPPGWPSEFFPKIFGNKNGTIQYPKIPPEILTPPPSKVKKISCPGMTHREVFFSLWYD